MSTLTPEEINQVNLLLGPWLVGDYLEVLLQGVILCQFAHYWDLYREDKPILRATVIGLLIITTLKSIQSFAQLWIQSITYYGDLPGAIFLSYTKWWQAGNPMMVALVCFYVQLYFCFRLWVISRKLYVVVPVLVLFVFALLSMCIATYYIGAADGLRIGIWFAVHLGTVFAGDMTLSLTTAYFLIKSKKDVLPQTVGLINALVRLTFQTALPAAICALVNLALSQSYKGETGLVSTAFNQMLPKLYAISMMWTLNARRSISVHHGSSGPSTSHDHTHRSRRTRGDELELGGIRVRTHVETVTVGDMYDRQDKSAHDTDGGEESLRKTAIDI